MIKNYPFKKYLIQSTQLAIIQAFPALWKIKFEQMVVILNCWQHLINEDNINHVWIKCIFNSCEANNHSIQHICEVWNHLSWKTKWIIFFLKLVFLKNYLIILWNKTSHLQIKILKWIWYVNVIVFLHFLTN